MMPASKLSKEKQEELLKDSPIFLGNRYRISDKMRRIFELSEEIVSFSIEEVWQMKHIRGTFSTMLHIRYSDGTSDHQGLDFMERLLCP